MIIDVQTESGQQHADPSDYATPHRTGHQQHADPSDAVTGPVSQHADTRQTTRHWTGRQQHADPSDDVTGRVVSSTLTPVRLRVTGRVVSSTLTRQTTSLNWASVLRQHRLFLRRNKLTKLRSFTPPPSSPWQRSL